MYKTSANISIEEIQDRFFLKDNLNNKVYEINHSIFDLLIFFNEPNMINSYIQKLSEKTQSTFSNVEKIIIPFFNQLLKANFITQEDNIQAINSFLNDESINCFDIIDNRYKILQIIQNKRYIDYVLLVEDIINTEKFVLKITLNKNEKYIKKSKNIVHEYDILKNLSSNTSIINTHGIVEKKDKTYMILEYLDNTESLYNFIKNNENRLDEKLKENLINQLLRTFSQIHKKEILHGDIHFKNILVHHKKNIKIIDFGLSNNFFLKKNEKENIGGIHYFIPPERIGNNSFKKLSTASTTRGEVYQIGLLMYFILFDKIPFDVEKWSELQSSILKGIKELPKEYYLTSFLLKCLDVNPEQRFSDGNDLYESWLNRKILQ